MWISPLFVYWVFGDAVMGTEPDYDRLGYGRQWGVYALRRPVGLAPSPWPSPRGGEGIGHVCKIHGPPVDSPACGSRHWRVHVVKGGQTDARTTTAREAVPMARQRKCRGT